jgi:hypothetical protein
MNAKPRTPNVTVTIANSAPEAAAKPAPALGQIIHVQVDEGVVLINNETGAPFAIGTPTPVTVTTTVLRRLQDQDFRRVD